MKEAPKHVILFNYSPTLKTYVSYDALVISSREFEDHDEPVLALVHFRHDDTASHHALNGVDWADTFERTLDVPHRDDRENQSFYWVEADEEAPLLRQQLKESQDSLQSAAEAIYALREKYAQTTEGTDEALQAIADAGARSGNGPALVPASAPSASLPSADASSPVIETKHYSDGSSATGPAPLPDQSPAQQDASELRGVKDEPAASE
jgi:hypothetical protein